MRMKKCWRKSRKRKTISKSNLSKPNMIFFRMEESSKVPLPSKMYTKPVDVPSHSFSQKKFGQQLTYDPMQWNEFYDSRYKIDD